ncbi:hypothetical protein EDB85DRAFT_2289928 [Lactarius pseudohatsudake]|nr:hypothetical protein EDB85DRAFT_2289928 [Lactarius pseudohatsudake]
MPFPSVEGVLLAALTKARKGAANGSIVDPRIAAKASGVNGDAPEGGALDDHDASALWFRLTAVDTLRVGIGRIFVPRGPHFFSVRGLDVDAMYAGAPWLVGEHDFRNLCKLDPANQLTSFQRWVVCPIVISSVHVLDVVGSAVLYNRVRYTTAVLLLIGARLEVRSVVLTLLNSNPDERRVAAHALSLAVLPDGKKTPPAHFRKGLHRTGSKMTAVRRNSFVPLRQRLTDECSVLPSTVSKYMVAFMRMLTSAQILHNPEYEPPVIRPDLGEDGSKGFLRGRHRGSAVGSG